MKFRASDTVLAAEANTASEAEAHTGAAVLRAAIPLIRNPRTSALRNSQFAVTGSALKGTATLAEADMIRLFVRPPYSGTSPMKTSQPKR